MDTKTFFDNFETIANAPGGIARLRELILDLARNGQIGIGESSEIAVEMMRSTPQLSDVEVVSTEQAFKSSTRTVYFTKIKDVIHVISQSVSKIKTTEMRQNGKYPVIDQGQMKIAGYTNHSPAIDASENPVIVFGDHTRNLKFVDFPFVVGADGVKVVRPHFFDTKFFFYMCKATRIPTRGYGRHFRHFQEIEVPIFSIDEQQYIVAKVDELMALCDQLESAQQQRDSLRTSARKSAIDSISTASTAEELSVAWKRINQNWTTFADTPESISSLRTLILKSAGQGKLQRNSATPNSGPRASLGELCDIYQPKTISKNELIDDGRYLVYGANGIIGRYDKFNHEFEEVTVTCRGATCGTVNVTAPKSWINGNAMVVRPKVDELTKEFLAVILRGLDYETVITGSAQPQITRQPLAKVLIWIPKLAEQQRIVFQVDRLMSLCDLLEGALLKKVELEEQISHAVTSEVAA